MEFISRDDFLGLCYQKSSNKHVSDYGVSAVWNLEQKVRIVENKWNKVINKYNT
jgi:hypothetical protein